MNRATIIGVPMGTLTLSKNGVPVFRGRALYCADDAYRVAVVR